MVLLLAACRGGPTSRGWRCEPQRHNLTCEACAAVALLAAHGIAADEDDFQAGIPRSDNPDVGFVGEVDAEPGALPPQGYGVHAEPIARRLRDYGLAARAERGRDAEWLRARLREGTAVLVWSTSDFAARASVALVDREGRTFHAVRWEHALLAVGFDASSIRLLDPGCGSARAVPWRDFLAGWGSLDRMAVWAPPRR